MKTAVSITLDSEFVDVLKKLAEEDGRSLSNFTERTLKKALFSQINSGGFDHSAEMAEKIAQSMKVEDYKTTTAALMKNVHFDEEIFNKVK